VKNALSASALGFDGLSRRIFRENAIL